MKINRFHKQSGASLMEVLVAMSISLVVTASMIAYLLAQMIDVQVAFEVGSNARSSCWDCAADPMVKTLKDCTTSKEQVAEDSKD